MERIIYSDTDGGVSIVIPVKNLTGTMEELAARVVPRGIAFEVIDTTSVPTDRTFRNAWVKSGATIQTDMPKAKELAHIKRREKRDAEFAPLDIQATIPAEADRAEVDRQVIRDRYAVMQVHIDGAKNETDLLSALMGKNNG